MQKTTSAATTCRVCGNSLTARERAERRCHGCADYTVRQRLLARIRQDTAATEGGSEASAHLYGAMARAYERRTAEARREACVTGNWERVARLAAQAERARQLAAQ